uniref:Uncharacterized protein n=1 Tax=Rhipicephalus zambeziensis TaxID=60191 RepID=A0A224YCG4_9ACAR
MPPGGGALHVTSPFYVTLGNTVTGFSWCSPRVVAAAIENEGQWPKCVKLHVAQLSHFVVGAQCWRIVGCFSRQRLLQTVVLLNVALQCSS